MFIYFHKNKFRSEKGQMAPFFILALVILIMMAMVTVNLSKVGFIKTDTSNAVDSGALAGGSVMANVFNMVAQQNAAMETAYWEFYAKVSALFVIVLGALLVAYIAAGTAETSAGTAAGAVCEPDCLALIPAGAAVASGGIASVALLISTATIASIIAAVIGYHLAQYYFYKKIVKDAQKGRAQAIALSQRFSFMNSAISQKLWEGSAPDDAELDSYLDSLDDLDLAPELREERKTRMRNNYREEFGNFLESLEGGTGAEYTYAWLDGQNRNHYVRVNASIDPLDDYELKVTAAPLATELAALGISLAFGYAAKASMAGATKFYSVGATAAGLACAEWFCCVGGGPAAIKCCPAFKVLCAGSAKMFKNGNTLNSLAVDSMTPIPFLLGGALLGLLPAYTVSDTAIDFGNDVELPITFIIAWIDDIKHNRLVRIDTTQHHEGVDLGIWQMRYPDASGNTNSYSVANFTGMMGKIHPPVLRHDADIVETDNRNISYNPCPQIVERVANLEKQVTELNDEADSLDSRADEAETQAQATEEEQAGQLLAMAGELRAEAEVLRFEAEEKQREIDQYKQAYTQCEF